jgi:hypothetical protein
MAQREQGGSRQNRMVEAVCKLEPPKVAVMRAVDTPSMALDWDQFTDAQRCR